MTSVFFTFSCADTRDKPEIYFKCYLRGHVAILGIISTVEMFKVVAEAFNSNVELSLSSTRLPVRIDGFVS